VLTAPGTVFLDEARRTLRQAEAAAQAARQAGEGTRGRLRIAYPPGPLPLRLSETITRFAVRHPAIQVVPETLRARQAVTDVSSGRIDVALVGLPALAPGLAVTVLSQERAVAAVPDRHPLSGQPEVRLDRFGQTHARAVATIITGSHSPVRLNDLVSQYRDLGPTLRSSAPDESNWTQFKRELGSLIQIRRADRPSTQPDARYTRALSALEDGEVDRALAETMRLPGAANAGPWVMQARQYVAVHRALDEIESGALLARSTPEAS